MQPFSPSCDWINNSLSPSLPNSIAGTLSSAPTISIDMLGTDVSIVRLVSFDNATRYAPEIILPISLSADISISLNSSLSLSSVIGLPISISTRLCADLILKKNIIIPSTSPLI